MSDVERDTMKRDLEDSLAHNARMEQRWREETYGRKLDALEFEGYRLGDKDHKEELLARIIKATDPEAEFAFQKVCHHRDPLGVEVNQRFARGPSASRTEMENQQIAATEAQKRCESEVAPDKFNQYYVEEMEKVKVA